MMLGSYGPFSFSFVTDFFSDSVYSLFSPVVFWTWCFLINTSKGYCSCCEDSFWVMMLCFKGFISLPFQHSSLFTFISCSRPAFPSGFYNTDTSKRTVCITQGSLQRTFILLFPHLFSLHVCVKTKWKFSVCQKLLFRLSDNNPKFGFLVIHL